MKAKTHWVELWSYNAPVGAGVAGSCDSDTFAGG
jgi:hypothetical protein